MTASLTAVCINVFIFLLIYQHFLVVYGLIIAITKQDKGSFFPSGKEQLMQSGR